MRTPRGDDESRPPMRPDPPARRRFLAAAGRALLGSLLVRAAPAVTTSESNAGVTLFLCGDVMTGRGIDQVLPHPGNPRLYEPYVRSALGYVELAEAATGPIQRPVDFSYPWGDALPELDRRRPAARIVNLETAVTTSESEWRGKGIHYRMHPANAPCLSAARIDCCSLANNHVLDWGVAGLKETLAVLHQAGIQTAGAGRNLAEAAAPAVFDLPSGGRLLVFAFGAGSAGVSPAWAATVDRPGVNVLDDFSPRAVRNIGRQIAGVKRGGDMVVASIHWGDNWGYEVPREQIEFAHGLIDAAGVDVVHGHSSHHPKAIEVHRDKLILYGCGDFINDYEGIGGHESYRADLTLMYFPTLDSTTGRLRQLSLTPMRIRHFRANRASVGDVRWLEAMLNREGRRFGSRFGAAPDGALAATWS